MKSNKYITRGLRLVTLCLLSALAACSNIKEDERLIFVEEKTLPGATDDNDDEFVARVLVEDFTGQRCTWCPQGTIILKEQMELYGEDHVIPVAIHSGPLGFKGTASAVGLMTDLGIYYWDKNGFGNTTSQPTAVFNRRTVTDERDKWGNIIYSELSRQAQVGIELATSYDEATRQLRVTATCKAKSALDGNLQLWLTESHIIALQIDGGTTNRSYEHDHILRDAINGNDGEAVSLGTAPQDKTATYTLDDKYVAENCQVVAFVYNNAGVQQVAVANVK